MRTIDKEHIFTLWIPLILAITLYCLGDVLLKIGNIEIESTLASLFQMDFWFVFITNFPIIVAFSFAILSKFIMGYVLSKNPFGLSEGLFLAFSVILAFLLGIIIFNEDFTIINSMAIFIISIGIVMINSENE